MKPLAMWQIEKEICWEKVLGRPLSNFEVFESMEESIGRIEMRPYVAEKEIQLCVNNYKAVIISGSGSLTSPCMNLLKSAIKSGVLICSTSSDSGLAAELEAVGCINVSMTLESLYAKIAYLLGKKVDRSTVVKMLKKNLRGEVQKKDKMHMGGDLGLAMVKHMQETGKHEELKRLAPDLLNTMI